MKSWTGYRGHFIKEMLNLQLSLVEKVLIGALVLMCVISAADSLTGRDEGNYQQVKMAKLQAQQELMASRFNQAK